MSNAIAPLATAYRLDMASERAPCVATKRLPGRYDSGSRRERALLPVAMRTACIGCDTRSVHISRCGAPARAIQELAGHQDLITTHRYMHLSPAALDSAIRLLETGTDIGRTAVEK